MEKEIAGFLKHIIAAFEKHLEKVFVESKYFPS